MLAIFAAQPGSAEVQGAAIPQPTFIEKIVPFYTQCLLEVCPAHSPWIITKPPYIQNSADGKLTTAQLRLAYSALTSSASGNAPAMGHFCLSSLLSALAGLSAADDAERRHRLRLVLVSTLSALPFVVLPDGLKAVSDSIRDSKGEERRELVKEVFKEIMENVGDQGKGYCLRWWEEEREGEGLDGSTSGKAKANSARL
jgi:hypothetical protein